MAAVLVAAALAAATPAAATAATAAPDNADPAIFVVRDADTTVYLFGTFHALDGKSEWFNDQVKDAFERSDELVLETLVPEHPSEAAFVAPPPQLRTSPVTSSASFLASARMAIKAGRTQGMQVANGADMVLRHVAEAEGKPVEGLETMESQIAMFTRLPTGPAVSKTPQPAPAINRLSQSMS